MKKFSCILLLSSFLFYCTPKGPQTFPSTFVGKTKAQLIAAKGPAQKIQLFENSEAVIYVKKEEYYGNVKSNKVPSDPKSVYEIEYIYYVNKENIVYKYQVWKRKIKK